MKRKIYDSIKREYDTRRKRAFDKLDERRIEVYSKAPRVRELEEKIQKAGIRCSRLILSGEDNPHKAADELNREIDKLKNQKKRLLLDSGFPEDYLNPVYRCSKCSDTGFYEGQRCSCFRQQVIEGLYRQSNLSRLDTENWDSFNEKYYSDNVNEKKYGIKISPQKNILEIKKRCEKFIEEFNNPGGRNLFFSGPPGTGKTFITSCVAGSLIQKGHTVLYQTAPSLFGTIGRYKARAYRDGNFDDEAYFLIFSVELLIIDDLGTESSTSARYAELLNILNTREMNNLKDSCKTIISTNLGPRKLYEYYTERVGSRIMGNFERLVFAGDDIRGIRA